jgi:hypothetical protein
MSNKTIISEEYNCINKIKNKYKERINKCKENFKNCNEKCNDDSCKYDCDIKYNCDELYKEDSKILNDINVLENIINNLDNIQLIYIKNISDIINRNFKENEKKKIKNEYANKLNCFNIDKPCLLNRKFLLHVILELLKKKYYFFNIQYNIIKECHKEIGEPTDN